MKLYRYESYAMSVGVHIYCVEFQVDKETPDGYWISPTDSFKSKTKWMKMDAKRPYAFKTKEEAEKSFIARTYAWLDILENQKKYAEARLKHYGLKPRNYDDELVL